MIALGVAHRSPVIHNVVRDTAVGGEDAVVACAVADDAVALEDLPRGSAKGACGRWSGDVADAIGGVAPSENLSARGSKKIEVQ